LPRCILHILPFKMIRSHVLHLSIEESERNGRTTKGHLPKGTTTWHVIEGTANDYEERVQNVIDIVYV